jgi:hypothetical protein
MILAEGKALAVLSHLIEGCSIRSIERLTGVHRDTILSLLTIAGRKCEALILPNAQNPTFVPRDGGRDRKSRLEHERLAVSGIQGYQLTLWFSSEP